MSEPSLPELEAERDRLFAQLSVPPDLPLPEDDYLGAGPLLPAAIS